MKIHYLLFLITISLIPATSFAERIKSFNSTIDINKDRSINITEDILYDFEDSERRGIYRTIPLRGIDIKGDIQTLRNSKTETQDVSRGGDITIRVGDEDVYITGLNQYSISYMVKGVIKKLQDRDELYWQVTGTEWDVPIEKASAKIILPEDLRDQVGDKLSCYAGVSSSNSQDCTIIWTNARTVEIKSNRPLAAGDGLTFAIGLPIGTLAPPIWWEVNKILFYRVTSGVILIGGIIMLYSVWNNLTKIKNINKIVVRQYEPPKELSPAGVARFKNIYPTTSEITATIISLASRGFLSITKIEDSSKESYKFDINNNSLYKTLKPFEYKLIDIIFKDGRISVTTKQLEDEKISNRLGEVYENVYDDEIKKYYDTREQSSQNVSIFLKIKLITLSIFISMLGLIFIIISISFLIGITLILIGGALFFIIIITSILSVFSQKLTEEGTLLRDYIAGFEEYIKVAEKDRLQFQEKEYIFFEILPYAIALGYATIWAKAFEDLITTNPDWYNSNNTSYFNTIAFTKSIDRNLSSSFSSTLGLNSSGVSASSGGGTVGGGSGGGGGGSW